jgi:transposase-like protein
LLLKKQGFAPTRITTDKLKSYPAAIRQEGLSAAHDQGQRSNNRAENSHQPVRRRERKQQRFNSPGSARRFLSIHAAVQNAFYVQRHLPSRGIFKAFRAETFVVWRQSCMQPDPGCGALRLTAAVNVSMRFGDWFALD